MTAGSTLITGANGFAGRHLLAHLAGRQRLVAWHRPGEGPIDTTVDAAWREVDVTDRDAVRRAVERDAPIRIYHLAGATEVDASWTNAVPHLQTNALGTCHLLETVRELVPRCRVLVSTSAQVYQASDDPIDEEAPLVPPSPYGLSKLAQDQIALRSAHDEGLDVVVARPFNHTGPGQRAAFAVPGFARQIARVEAGLDPPMLRVGNLDARRDLTDVRDVVDAYELLAEGAPAGRPYNICSGQAWRIGDLLEELLNRARVAIQVTADETRLRPNDIAVVQGDATRIRSELGWTPRIPVERTLGDTLDWWRRHLSPD
jgi:GDP-4-dehydro-6-deoxy-D-mannose reductase